MSSVRVLSETLDLPLELLKRVGDANGFEILNAEYSEGGGKRFYHRIVGKVGNVYFEAIDAMYRSCDEFVPCVVSSTVYEGTLSGTSGLAAVPSLSTQNFMSTPTDSRTFNMVVVPASCFLDTPPLALSMFARTKSGDKKGITYGSAGAFPLGFGGPIPSPLGFSLVSDPGNSGVTGTYTYYVQGNTLILTAAVGTNLVGVVYTQDVVTSYNLQAAGSGPYDLDSYSYTLPAEGQTLLVCMTHTFRPVLLSTAVIRASAAYDSDNSTLSTPTNWVALPLYKCLTALDNGLIWTTTTGNTNAFKDIMVLQEVDTSKGSGSTPTPAFFRNLRHTWGVPSNIATPANRVIVQGDGLGGISGTKNMSMFTATPPISHDAIAGGPVVSDVFVYDNTEIRGTLSCLLGASGEPGSGWLDGKRYESVISGLMMRNS